MIEPHEFSVARVRAIQDDLRGSVRDDMCVEEAAQLLAHVLWGAFAPDLVLVRVYSTLPFAALPAFDQERVERATTAGGGSHKLGPYTPVLSLLATRGIEAAWNDRRESKKHLGIPFLTTEFVRALPMITALFTDLGLSIEGLVSPGTSGGVHTEQLLGGEPAGIFYVANAKTTLDPTGRRIIPQQDFVERYGVQTVFGMGGSWPNQSLLTCIVFLRTTVDRIVVRRLAPLLTVFRAATTGAAMNGRYFIERTRTFASVIPK